MLLSDVCYLIEDTPKSHGVYDRPAVVLRKVYCTVQSVGRQEYYAALSAGLQPSLVLKLADTIEYENELRLMFHDQEYRIVRTYMTKDGGIELTIERKVST